MTLTCTIFVNKEQKIGFHYHNNISLTWGLIIINYIFFINFCFSLCSFFFILFDTVNDKLSSFYNYLYNNTPSKAIVNAAYNITYRPLIEADDTGR